MTRLTKQLRAHICQKAVSQSELCKREKELDEKYKDFVEKCRVISIGGPELEKHIERDIAAINKRLEKYPEGVFEKADCNRFHHFVIVHRGERHYQYGPDTCKNKKRPPCNDILYLDKHPELQKEYDELLRAQEKNNEEISRLRADLNGMLFCVNTVKQLMEVWPEARTFLPETSREPGTNLPIVSIRNLNERLGLKSSE
jgi:hypothetical protein